jgi:hypothetical protein
MYCRIIKPASVPNDVTIREAIQGLGSSLFGLCVQEDPKLHLVLTAEEVHAVKHMFGVLQTIYEEHQQIEHSCMAMDHLIAIRALVQQAEQAQSGFDSREGV